MGTPLSLAICVVFFTVLFKMVSASRVRFAQRSRSVLRTVTASGAIPPSDNMNLTTRCESGGMTGKFGGRRACRLCALELLQLNGFEVALGGEVYVYHIDIWGPQLGSITVGQDRCIGVGQQFNCHRSRAILYFPIPSFLTPNTIRTRNCKSFGK